MYKRRKIRNLKRVTEKQKEPDYYLQDLEKHRDKSKEYVEYANKRFDILVITIATVGVGFVANYIKDMTGIDKTIPYITIGLFSGCLFLNLFAQIFSKRANNLAVKKSENTLYQHRYDAFPSNLTEQEFIRIQKNYKQKINRNNLVISIMDWISLAALIGAISVFLYFTFSLGA